MYYKTIYPSPVGLITLACDEFSLVGLWIEGQKYHGNSAPGTTMEKDDTRVFGKVKDWLGRYFSGDKLDISGLPLAPAGSAFRKEVWAMLCEIPYGRLTTYGDIAGRIAANRGKETFSSRAIGGAVGHNPISIIIPCHRVVGANGSLVGYAGGVDVKAKLLELEGVDISCVLKNSKKSR